MELLKTSQRFIKCEVCDKFLVVDYKPVVNTIVAVCDVVDITEMGDRWQSFAPITPAHFFCVEHGREEKQYKLQEIKENVWI